MADMKVFKDNPKGWIYTVSDAPTSKQLFKDLAPDYNPKSDAWGYAMDAGFKVAAMCYIRGIANSMDYRPSMAGPQSDLSDSEDNEGVQALLYSLTDTALERLAEYIARVLRMLERNGKDY